GTDGRVLKYSKTTSVAERNSGNLHQRLIIEQNYPNPFNPSTIISYTLPESGRITLKVFDLLGKEVASLLDEYQEAGDHDIEFNTRVYNIPSGIYFYRLQTGKFIQTRKMLFLK
ncbi:MAG: T9SS type A sorting domain-containing protein, partial [Bacteroidota bacterium]